MMGAARLLVAVGAVCWWVIYLTKGGGWVALVAAVSLTIGWAGLIFTSGIRRTDQMVDPKPEDPES
jgi:hypothetical protein